LGLVVIKLGERHLGVGVDNRLLIDPPDHPHQRFWSRLPSWGRGQL
jgi:hypothetical protein